MTTFTAHALTDGRDRASAHFAAESTALGSFTASTVLPWLRASGVTQLVTPYATVGPVRDRLDLLTNDLAGEGVTLSRAIRSWDARAWPHATRGFFPFRERIPELLREERQ